MIRALILIFGVLIAIGGVVAAWNGVGAMDDITKLEAQIYGQKNNRAAQRAGEAGKERIAEFERQMEEKRTERNIWIGGAIGALALGVAMAMLSLSRKRKASNATLVPAQDQKELNS